MYLDTPHHGRLHIVEGNLQARDFGGCIHVPPLGESAPGAKLGEQTVHSL